MMNVKKARRKAVMVGLGLDSDGHKRLTTGPNFVLMGGSAETHEVMTEKVIKVNEKLAAAGKQLEDNLGSLSVDLSAEQRARLDEVSKVDLGFPHDFLQTDIVRQIVSGGAHITRVDAT